MPRDPKMSISRSCWSSLLDELRCRTEGRHESGAFLLGQVSEHGRRVDKIVYYDDLDPNVHRTGIVVMHAASFGLLWDLCRAGDLSVVADIHVHPRGAFQSLADRNNPMIALSGHLALIVPFFARSPVRLEDLGFFEYRGGHRWRDLSGKQINRYFHIEP